MAIKNRNSIVGLIIDYVTCNLYGLYWRWVMAKDAQSVIGEENTLEAILMVLLPFIGYFMVEKKYAAACEEKGIEHKENAILYLILALIPIAAPIADMMFQNELNKLAPVEE